MAHEKLRPEYFFDEAKIAKLKHLAPECFEDGKINFTTLSQNLGDWRLDEEDPELEHFGLFWPGKRDARKAAALPPEGTLEPVWGDGLKSDGTPDSDGTNDSKNIFIEGENLEVLKLLQKSYAGKIKMIYIDPPYNTGNDFVYDDDFTEPLQEYLRRTGQVDEEGKAISTNKRNDGRFHSKWLSMMYPRLRLAKNLLREDGVIFVSIGDNEDHNLKAILNEIFGEENFLAQLIWNSEGNTDNQLEIKINHEYILVYTKNFLKKQYAIGKVIDPNTREDSNLWKGYADNNINKNNPANPPSIIELPIGFPCSVETLFYKKKLLDDSFFEITKNEKYISDSIKNQYSIENLSGLPVKLDDMEVENFKLVKSCRIYGGFANSNKLKTFIENNFNPVIDDDGSPIHFYININSAVRYHKEVDKPSNILSVLKNFGTTEKTKTELKRLGIHFSYPKPIGLLKYLISIGAQLSDSIVLDFFAGSGSLGHAILQLNLEDESFRKFICVQFPEKCDETSEAFKNGFENISEIAKDRLRKVIKNEKLIDGFISLKLKESNYKQWKNYQGTSINELERQLVLFNQNPLRESFTKEGLLTEIILIEGFALCSTVSKMDEMKSNTIRKIASEYCQHALLVCLDEKIEKETIAGLQFGKNDIFICLDSAISTEDKLRLSDKGLIKTI